LYDWGKREREREGRKIRIPSDFGRLRWRRSTTLLD
jgi:hypothetical protein